MLRILPNTYHALNSVEAIGAEVSCKCFGSKKDAITQSGEKRRLLEGFRSWDFKDKRESVRTRRWWRSPNKMGQNQGWWGPGCRCTGLTDWEWPPERWLGPSFLRCPKVPSAGNRILGQLNHGANLLWYFFFFCIPFALTMRWLCGYYKRWLSPWALSLF